MSAVVADPQMLLHENFDLWEFLRKMPFSRQDWNLIEEDHFHGAVAFSTKKPRKTGEPAFAHSQRTAMRVARIMKAAGYFRSEPIRGALLHDVPEDTEAATPHEKPLDGYYRMPARYGEVLARILFLVSRGRRMPSLNGARFGQTEEEHLEQLEVGEEYFYHHLKVVLNGKPIRTMEEALVLQLAAVIYGVGYVVRRMFGLDVVRRYPLPTDQWILFVARVIKVSDRLDNLETYIHPLVYGRCLDQLRYKLDLTKRYYVSIARKALEAAPAAFKEPVRTMLCQELDRWITYVETYLSRVDEKVAQGELCIDGDARLVAGSRGLIEALAECRDHAF